MLEKVKTRVRCLVVAAIAGALCTSLLACTTENKIHCDKQDDRCPEGQRCDFTRSICVAKEQPKIDSALPTTDGLPGADQGNGVDGKPGSDGPVADAGPSGKPNGQACSATDQCESGFCVDEVCCAAPCAGTCRSCNLPGKAGSCELQLDGQDPRGDCQLAGGKTGACDGVCDGAGACRFPGEAESCGQATCATGELTLPRCDGAGLCDAKKDSCGGFGCTAAGDACKTSCTGAGDCVSGFTCIGGTCKNPQPNGKPCGTNNDACASGQCTDGVCCGSASCPVCNACDLNGSGTCSAVSDGPTCGAVTCNAAQKSTPTCTGGACVPVKQGCSPYTCNVAGDDCRVACSDPSHCLSGFYCNGTDCVPKRPLGQLCTEGWQCLSDKCTEGVCCDKTDCGTCKSCKVSGSVGTCANLPDGVNQSHCPGDESCGARCESGTCAYLAAGSDCAAETCSAGVITKSTCDSAHACNVATTNCSPYSCESSTKTCLTSCNGHTQCFPGGACSFSKPDQATGECTKPTETIWITSSQSPSAYFASHKVIVLQGDGPHPAFTITGSTHIIGGNHRKTRVEASAANTPAIQIAAGMSDKITIEGIKLVNSHDGVLCTSGTKISVFDAVIGNNASVGIKNCNAVKVYRAEIGYNLLGGIVMPSGANEISDSLIFNNGTHQMVGGVPRPVGMGGITGRGFIRNCTIWNNIGSDYLSSAAGGLNCDEQTTVESSIIWGNEAGEFVGTCSFTYSTVNAPIPSGTGNDNTSCSLASGKPAAGSPCINSGYSGIPTKLDFAKNPRVLGGGPDRGAWEIQ